MKNLVILYTKFPRMGNTKTRIAQESNEQFAWIVGFYSLTDTINKVSHSSEYDLVVVVNSEVEARIFREKFGVNTYALNEKTLTLDQSGRFTYLFSLFIKKYQKVMLIPSDVPAITEKTLIDGFKALNSTPYTFGPEHNGGVYLIGMNKSPKKLFDNVRWSTSHSVKDLFKNAGKNAQLLECKGDLNVLQDLFSLQDSIEKYSPLLYTALTKVGLYRPQQKLEEFSYAYY